MGGGNLEEKNGSFKGHFIISDQLKKNKITRRKAKYGPILFSSHVEGPLLQITESYLAHGYSSSWASSSMMPSTGFWKLTRPKFGK